MSSHYTVKRSKRFPAVLADVVVAVLILVAVISGWMERWLWVRQTDYAGIFLTLLSVQWAWKSQNNSCTDSAGGLKHPLRPGQGTYRDYGGEHAMQDGRCGDGIPLWKFGTGRMFQEAKLSA